VDQPVERPHIRRLSGVATPLRHRVNTPFLTDKLVEGTGHAVEQDRADVLSQREAWFEGQPDLDPARLVFIDET